MTDTITSTYEGESYGHDLSFDNYMDVMEKLGLDLDEAKANFENYDGANCSACKDNILDWYEQDGIWFDLLEDPNDFSAL